VNERSRRRVARFAAKIEFPFDPESVTTAVMCWNGWASSGIAVAGLSSAYFLQKKGQPKEIYIPPAYFVLMEGL
jgi:hypothetical protein